MEAASGRGRDGARTLGNGLDRRPPNYSFAQGNVLEGLSFGDETFDFVHQRLLITAIPRRSLVLGDRRADVGHGSRGGWVELAECGVPEHGGPGLTGLWQSWIALCGKRNVDFTMGYTIAERLARASLQRVDQRVRSFQMGAYGGRVGQMPATNCLLVGQALRGGAIAAGILFEPEYDRLYQFAQAELSAPEGKGALPFYVACGQRAAA